jgi:hypothetical protein
MPELNLLEDLASAIALVSRETPVESSREVAEKFYEDEPELVKHFAREWIIETLASLIRRRRLKTQLEEDPQMVLGFKPPSEIVWREDEKVSFDDATLWKLRLHRTLISKAHKDHKHPAVVKIEKAIELMEPYAHEHHGITWSEVVKLEAEKKGKKTA